MSEGTIRDKETCTGYLTHKINLLFSQTIVHSETFVVEIL